MIIELLDRLFRREEINGGNRCPTYLYRWTVFQPRRARWLWRGFGIYVHRFVADDWSRDLHDHPKRFISIGVAGAYIETTPKPPSRSRPFISWRVSRTIDRVYRAPWIRTFPATHIHRIRLIDYQPCWTIVIVLWASREWGFWHLGRWTHWREYVASDTATTMKSCP